MLSQERGDMKLLLNTGNHLINFSCHKMTSVLPDQQRNVVRIMKQKQNKKPPNDPAREETRSFLKFSRENLSLSNSDLEQGFNKTKFRVGRHTILSVTALVLALACVGIEICRLKWMVDNSREMEILKRDVDTLKHRLLEEDLLDELKAFEEKVRILVYFFLNLIFEIKFKFILVKGNLAIYFS